MLITNRCPRCNNGIEFESEHVGEAIQCPHCGQDVMLSHAPIVAPVPMPTRVKKKAPAGFRGREFLMVLIFIAGGLIGLGGALSNTSASAAVLMCGGGTIATLALIGSILITIGENASKK